MNNIPGIYKIQSILKPDKFYIGSAQNLHRRWIIHLNFLKHNTHRNRKLQNHYNKYGEIDLQFSIICVCDKNDLLKKEQYFINLYKPYFNICLIAGSE